MTENLKLKIGPNLAIDNLDELEDYTISYLSDNQEKAVLKQAFKKNRENRNGGTNGG